MPELAWGSPPKDGAGSAVPPTPMHVAAARAQVAPFSYCSVESRSKLDMVYNRS